MAEAILTIIGSVLGWLAAKGIDAMLGKWYAHFTILWEQKASLAAKERFNATMRALKTQTPETAKAWEDWRKKMVSRTGIEPVTR